MNRVFLFGLLAVILLGGCVSNPPKTEPIAWQALAGEIPDGMAQIYVVRPSAYVGSANRYLVEINGEKIGVIRTGYYIVHEARAGELRVKAKTEANVVNFGLALAFMGEPELQFRVEAGKLYFVRVDVAFSGGPALEVVDLETGKRLVEAAQREPLEESAN